MSLKAIYLSFLFLISLLPTATAQHILIVADSLHSSLRGLSVVDDQVVWASGSNGTVGKSLDGGNTWDWMVVKGFKTTDFRDITTIR